MPEHLAPDVFIEEIERGPRPIEGVAASTAAFLGETERGPTRPTLVTSFNEYRRQFGGAFGPDKFLPCERLLRNGGAKKEDPAEPANDTLRGLFDIEYHVDDDTQQVLNPRSVNAIRSFPGRGIQVWGARTLTDNSPFRYISVRRLVVFLEHSINESIQWASSGPMTSAFGDASRTRSGCSFAPSGATARGWARQRRKPSRSRATVQR